jgi:hypothetical protein
LAGGTMTAAAAGRRVVTELAHLLVAFVVVMAVGFIGVLDRGLAGRRRPASAAWPWPPAAAPCREHRTDGRRPVGRGHRLFASPAGVQPVD